MSRGGVVQGSRMPHRGPSPQHGLVVPPPYVVMPPVGGVPPGGQLVGANSPHQDPGKRVVRILDIYLPEVFPIPGSQEFQGYYYNAVVAGPGTTVVGLLLQVPPFYNGIIRTVDAFAT